MEITQDPEAHKQQSAKTFSEISDNNSIITHRVVIDTLTHDQDFSIRTIHQNLDLQADTLSLAKVDIRERMVIIKDSNSPMLLVLRFLRNGLDVIHIEDTTEGSRIVEGGHMFTPRGQHPEGKLIPMTEGSNVIYSVSGVPDYREPTEGAWQSMLQSDQKMLAQIGRVRESIKFLKPNDVPVEQPLGGVKKMLAQFSMHR